MQFVLLSLIAQITCLVSLINSGHEYFYLAWYIPNYCASALILFPKLSGKKDKISKFLLWYIYLFVLVGNIVVTCLYLPERWVGAAPAIVSLALSRAYSLTK